MKINYTQKRTITTADLFDATDPPLIFEVRTRPARSWATLYRTFEDDGGNNPAIARQLIAMAFLTVSDGENVYALDTEEQAQALQDAIEANNPGYGEEFSCNIAWAFGRNHYVFLGDRVGNSLEPLTLSNGRSGAKLPAKAS